MHKRRQLLSSVTAAGVLLAGLGSPAAAEAPVLEPHRAFYEVRLKSAGTSGGPADVTGAIVTELAETCTGWRERHNTLIRFVRADGVARVVRSDATRWESKDGLTFTFVTTHRIDGQAQRRFSGRARLFGPGQGGEAAYHEPVRRRFYLPRGTIFPVRLMIDVLKSARTDSAPVRRILFNGSSKRPLSSVNAVIGKVREPAAMRAPAPLLNSRRWPIMIAYFSHGQAGSQPYYQLAVHFHENGVSNDMVFELGNITLNGKLKKVQPLPRPRCQR